MEKELSNNTQVPFQNNITCHYRLHNSLFSECFNTFCSTKSITNTFLMFYNNNMYSNLFLFQSF